MEDTVTLMPFALKIRTYVSPYGDLYSADGEKIVQTKKEILPRRTSKNKLTYMEYDDALYSESINIGNSQDAMKFIQGHPNLRFMMSNSGMNQTEKISTYSAGIVHAVSAYHQIMRLSIALDAYRRSPDDEHLIDICSAYMEASPIRALCSNIKAERHVMFRDLVHKVIQTKEVSEEESAKIINVIQPRYHDYVNSIIDEANIQYDPSSLTVTYVCDTVLSAMYMHRYLELFNQNEYRKCAEPGCNKYFLVDKHYPQSRCDEHMRTRRNKRKNYKQRQKEEDQYARDHMFDNE